MLAFLPEWAETPTAEQWKPNMSVGSKRRAEVTGAGDFLANPALQVPTCITTSTSPSRARLVTACAPRSGAYSFDYTELLPPSDILSAFSPGILPPAGKSRPPYSKQRLSHESLELFGSSTTRCAAARMALSTQKCFPRAGAREILPANGVSGFCRRQAKAASPNSNRRYPAIPSYVARCRRREAAPMVRLYRNASRERDLSSRTSNLTEVEFPVFSGIRFFAVRRAKLANRRTKGLPASREPRCSVCQSPRSKIKFRFLGVRRSQILYGYMFSLFEVFPRAPTLRKLHEFHLEPPHFKSDQTAHSN
ncbi:hypothetical protein R3P38DRAFT_3375225 [Favolaschia claudopus]|uniref:Uncharacterized protein n=1 Tax=Favolaschia claudopus TaxID=2862362 RepID=A0AAV9ZIW7_9AGAR